MTGNQDDSMHSEESLVDHYPNIMSTHQALGTGALRDFEREKQVLRKHYSSKRKIGQKS